MGTLPISPGRTTTGRALAAALLLGSVGLAGSVPAGAQAPTAFVDVTVVPMDEERLLRGQTVVVQEGRIVAVGAVDQVEPPAEARIVDGRGRFLMPGLADMHVHTWDLNDLFLFVANGVTTVRDMSGKKRHLDLRERIPGEGLPAPTMHVAGRILNGKPGFTLVETAEDATRIVREQKQAGFEFVKVYTDLSPTAYDAIVREASASGLPVVGHVPSAVGLHHALRSGQASIEHLSGYLLAAQAEDAPNPGTTDWTAVAAFDETRLPEIARWTRASGVWNCVTLVAMRRFRTAEEAARLLARPEVRYVAPASRESWKAENFKDWTEENLAPFRKAESLLLEITRALHDAGAPILLGTDAPNPHVAPGFSIHEELALLVRAGLSPYEAIRAGTRDAAEFLDRLEEFGTVRVGLRADLILLEADPLEDVAHVRNRVGVMLRGRWFPEAELQGRLEEFAASYGYLGTASLVAGSTSTTPTEPKEDESTAVPLLALVIAVPAIAVFFLFVLLPRLRRHETQESKPGIDQSSRPQR